MRKLVALCLALSLPACGLVYKLPTRQGNVIEQKQLDQLKTGMTRDQVRFLMGTPLAASPFRDDRWDYVGYYKTPRGQVFTRTVSLYFDGDKLARTEGAAPPSGGDKTAPDTGSAAKEEKKLKEEKVRGDQPG
ncbi:MAG TPA: outer membrane protein assembly factor BamE [Nevskiaceae bacterium]|nr:outer membrane protein assembly factor BamE [Nevskiaceae bacterium]